MFISSNMVFFSLAVSSSAIAQAPNGQLPGIGSTNPANGSALSVNTSSASSAAWDNTTGNFTKSPSDFGATAGGEKLPGDMSTGKCLCPPIPACPSGPLGSSPAEMGNATTPVPPPGVGSGISSAPPSELGPAPGPIPANSTVGEAPPPLPDMSNNLTSAAGSARHPKFVGLVTLLASGTIGFTL
ncbi:hypothetical protein O181_013789 [Austropuccinia psidii MF-1]|uniref:Uncharacterized protein n=1 Tax=Austropuccinia psidii MF-1 TaxID=1389203 RepID=A0A9Q3BX27_9BASI|nr:hypothetical protein [Austropuccinia psidii MF-1]